MKVITTSPFYTPLRLSGGLDPQSVAFADTLAAIPKDDARVHIPNGLTNTSTHKYEDLRDDDYDLRLFVFSPAVKDKDPIIRFHVYGNGISIVTVEFDCLKSLVTSELEQQTQDVTKAAVNMHAPALKVVLETIYSALPRTIIEPGTQITDMSDKDLSWISRAVILSRDDLRRAPIKIFAVEWLKNTARPADAQALLNGTITESMTWLNYLVVEPNDTHKAMLFSALRIAQYFYASQEALNSYAYKALTNSTLEKNVRLVEQALIDARRHMQMLHIMYDMQIVFLNRRKRQQFDAFMTVWEFDRLKVNGERMVVVSDTKITEITNKRTERSSFFTDLILVGLALVTVIEVSMYLTEYSREVMSRPALAYQDDKASWILSTIAAIDTDKMLTGGAFVILILVSFYVYWKIKR